MLAIVMMMAAVLVMSMMLASVPISLLVMLMVDVVGVRLCEVLRERRAVHHKAVWRNTLRMTLEL